MVTARRKTGRSMAAPRRVPSGLTRMQGDSGMSLRRTNEGPAANPSWRSKSLFTLLGRSIGPVDQPQSLEGRRKQTGGRSVSILVFKANQTLHSPRCGPGGRTTDC